MTWSKYSGNPVLTRGSASFRDPKVFRYEGTDGAWWVLAAVEAQQQQVVFYRSGTTPTSRPTTRWRSAMTLAR